MNMYYIRALPSDWTTLLALGQKLGAITVDEEGTVQATQGGAWDYIGEIHKPTGAMLTNSEGFEYPEMAPVVDANGAAYWHANLITQLALGAVAGELAAQDPAVAAGLENLGRFFLLDANGDATAPNQPHRVFAGM